MDEMFSAQEITPLGSLHSEDLQQKKGIEGQEFVLVMAMDFARITSNHIANVSPMV
mgnify:CR=1 FL=1